MKEQRTLCGMCAAAYRDAGYIVRRDYSVTIKDNCDICGRLGWDYYIWQKTSAENYIQAKHGRNAVSKY